MGELGCNVTSFMDCSKRNNIKNTMLGNFNACYYRIFHQRCDYGIKVQCWDVKNIGRAIGKLFNFSVPQFPHLLIKIEIHIFLPNDSLMMVLGENLQKCVL